MEYVRLVSQCLRTYGLLCLGVCRLLDDVVDNNEVRGQRTLTRKRYVITHPPNNFRLINTDKVLMLVLLTYPLGLCDNVMMVLRQQRFSACRLQGLLASDGASCGVRDVSNNKTCESKRRQMRQLIINTSRLILSLVKVYRSVQVV